MTVADESPVHRTVTVVIPTHDHGPTLRWSVASALAQTIQNIEIFIIGDGVPESARAIIQELVSSDSRIRYFDHPKGPRNGEIYRHEVLRYARGEFVAYLSDDDLWFPSHLETMQQLLRAADFATALPFFRSPDGSLHLNNVDLAVPYYRHLMLSGESRVPLSCGAHTVVAYRRLPEGWRTTPPGRPTDQYMWQQFLENPMCRAVTAMTPTVLNFPSPLRPSWSANERAAELELAWKRLRTPSFTEEFLREVVATDARERTRLEVHCSFVQRALTESQNASKRLEEERRYASEEALELRRRFVELEEFHHQKVAALEASRTSGGEAISLLQSEKDIAAKELIELQRTSTWRLRERILRWPLVAALAVRLAKLLAGRSVD